MSSAPPHFEILVEDESTRIAVEALVPAIRAGASCRAYPHQGKDQLLKRLPQRLRSYRSIMAAQPNMRVVVLIDRDAEPCRPLKQRLIDIAGQQGLAIGSIANRIVVEELEAWFLGDWQAVRTAFPRAPQNARVRDPDAVPGGTWEYLERLLRRGNYYQAGLLKTDAATRIAPHMDPDRNVSPSFRAFREAIQRA